ncbi:MAG: FG-GAP repeat domain-containing protein, partial [Burkholderiales bacterium]
MTSSFQTRKWVLLTCAAITGLMAVTIPADAETPKPLSLRGEIDLDGNGKSVLLLRSNKAQMQVGRLVGNKLQFSTLADPGLNFKLAGVSDFDGDGKSDLVLVNTTTPERGDVRAWTNFSPSGDKLLR